MPADLRISSLISAGLIVDSVIQNGDTITVTAHASAKWRRVLSAGRRRRASIVGMCGRFRIFPARGGASSLAS